MAYQLNAKVIYVSGQTLVRRFHRARYPIGHTASGIPGANRIAGRMKFPKIRIDRTLTTDLKELLLHSRGHAATINIPVNNMSTPKTIILFGHQVLCSPMRTPADPTDMRVTPTNPELEHLFTQPTPTSVDVTNPVDNPPTLHDDTDVDDFYSMWAHYRGCDWSIMRYKIERICPSCQARVSDFVYDDGSDTKEICNDCWSKANLLGPFKGTIDFTWCEI